MDATLVDGRVRVPGGRERFYDTRGYGRPDDEDLLLAPVEAAHLLFRGDLDAVDGDDLRAFLARAGADRAETGDATPGGFDDLPVRFVVYKDFRDRGFYLSVADDGTFVVYPQGKGPWDGEVEYRVRPIGEREPVAVRGLGAGATVLAVVDEEGELTYFETDRPAMEGSNDYDPPDVTGRLVGDRVLAWDPPDGLHERGFYGQRLYGRNADSGPLQLSLVEAAALADRDRLALAGAPTAVHERGRTVEGDRFDRRLRAYRELRGAGVVPKTGFKFGADFRTYADFADVDSMGHSERLVRVVDPDRAVAPRDLSLDVRLAGGVRKEMVFGLVGDRVQWRLARRLTP